MKNKRNRICSPSEYADMIGRSTRWVQLKCAVSESNNPLYFKAHRPELPGIIAINRIGASRWAITMHKDYALRIEKYWGQDR